MKKWRKANPDYYKSGTSYVKGKLKQRYCKECNVEIGKGKQRCPECMIIHRRAKAREHYKYTPEKREYAKRWREANPDKIKVYEQREKDKLGPKYCHRCNVEIERKKKYCSPCYLIVQKELKKIYNDKAAGYRKERYENRDKDAYNAYYRAYFRKNRNKILEYQSMYQKKLRKKQKQNWYNSRLARIEKLKGYLEEKKIDGF